MAEEIYGHIGRRIREERTRRDWTQQHLAELADMPVSYVGQIERSERKPSLKTLKRVADVFQVKAGDLLDESAPDAKRYPLVDKIADVIRKYPPKKQEALYKAFREMVRQMESLAR